MKVLSTRANLLLVAILFVLGAVAAWHATATTQTRPAVGMSAECHQAYHGYMEASDPAEADFWAESWMTFGCETGGGYWA